MASLSMPRDQAPQLNHIVSRLVSKFQECARLVEDSKTTRTGWRKDKYALPTDALERTLKRSAEAIVKLYQECLGDFGPAVHNFDVATERSFDQLNERCVELRADIKHAIDSKHRIKNAELLQETASEIRLGATDALQSMRIRLVKERPASGGTRPVDIPVRAGTTTGQRSGGLSSSPYTIDSGFSPEALSRSFSEPAWKFDSSREVQSLSSRISSQQPDRRLPPSRFDLSKLDGRQMSNYSTSAPDARRPRQDPAASNLNNSSRLPPTTSPPSHHPPHLPGLGRASTLGIPGQTPSQQGMTRSRGATFTSPPTHPPNEITGAPSPLNNYWGFCKGAWDIQNEAAKCLSIIATKSTSTNQSRSMLECSIKGCHFQGPRSDKDPKGQKTPQPDDKILRHPSTSIRFRWLFLAKSHKTCATPHDPNAAASDPWATQHFGCLFCCAERVVSPSFLGADALLAHVYREHSDWMGDEVARRNAVVRGRIALPEERFDINIPQGFQEARRAASVGGSVYFELGDGRRSPVGPSELE